VSPYTGEMVIKALPLPKRKWWQFLPGLRPRRSFVFERPFEYHGQGIHVYIPAGSTTDFTSIPFPASILLDPYGPWAEDAAVHDFNYRSTDPEKYSKDVADAVFMQAMRENPDVRAWERWLIFKGVEYFGAKHYVTPKEKVTWVRS
jgi:hypothetical protein